MSTPDYSTGSHNILINIGMHSLSIALSGANGPPSGASCPPTTASWTTTALASAAPAGPPKPPTAETIASELNTLLDKAKLPPPYVTIAHSWGGVTSMEFLASRAAGEVAGMVFVDAGAPTYFKMLPTMFAIPSVKAVNGEAGGETAEASEGFIEITGMRGATVLTSEEWDAFRAEEASEGHQRQAGLEVGVFAGTFDTLAEKGLLEREEKVLGKGPVCVLRGGTDRDFEKMYQWGVGKGNGTVEQQKEYRAILDGWEEKDVPVQKQFFKLTAGKTRFMQAPKSGHNVQLTEPEVVVEAVKRVMDNLEVSLSTGKTRHSSGIARFWPP